jgi:hypothetical protein
LLVSLRYCPTSVPPGSFAGGSADATTYLFAVRPGHRLTDARARHGAVVSAGSSTGRRRTRLCANSRPGSSAGAVRFLGQRDDIINSH